jgi:CheY-like chemotaxis protein
MAQLRLPYRAATEAPPGRGLVLLVEDSDDIRAAVRAMLVDLGHSVIEATNVDEALALADLPGLACVLSDITLIGEKTGLDLARTLAARPDAPAICLMTALPPEDPLRRAAAGRFPVLQKPFGEAALARLIAERHAA